MGLFILGFANRFKPLLELLLPRSFLRAVKHLVRKSADKEMINARPAPFRRNDNADGVNLLGPVYSVSGLGQSCRIVAAELAESELPFTICEYAPVTVNARDDNKFKDKVTDTMPYNINIVHINPYELSLAYMKLDRKIWDNRYNIMFWLWESEDFPEEWLPALNLADEIWTPSVFSGIGIGKRTDKPVITIPYAIADVPVDIKLDRKYFNLPEDKFLFMCSYDSGSLNFRKNPQGAIKAYCDAFSKEQPDCGFVVKVSGAGRKEITSLRAQFKGYENVYFVTDVLSRVEMNSLINCVDVYISLHRAEGFGLVCAEAMFLGKAVVATNWSANTEFMTDKTACMVDYEIMPLANTCGVFKRGTLWAEPNIKHAADYIRRLYTDTDYRKQIAENAGKSIAVNLSVAKSTERIRKRIDEIYSNAE